MKLSEMSIKELKAGIYRCRSRLDGSMPIGYMTESMVKVAINQYRTELLKRGQNELEFK